MLFQDTAKNALCSFNDALRNEKDDKDTVSAMASLSMQHIGPNMVTSNCFIPNSPQDLARPSA